MSRIRFRRVKPGLSMAVVFAVLVAACGGGGDGGGGEPDAGDGDGGAGDDPQTIVVGTAADIVGLDITKVSVNTNFMLPNIFDTLTRRQLDGSNGPHVATNYEVSEDGLTWTIELRDDVTFHNGDHMTAEDVAWTFNLVASDDFQEWNLWNYWNMVDEAVAVDDYTVELHLSEPNPLVEHYGPRLFVLPKDHYEEVGPEAFAENPVGTGPFKFVEWRPDDVLIMEAFDDYFLGRPEVDEISFRPIPDDAGRVAALRAGEVDIVAPLALEQIPTIEEDSALEWAGVEGLQRMRIVVDTFAEPFDQREVRLAINHAIDRELIVDELLNGLATIIPTALVPVEPGYNGDIEPYAYDPDLAREYLAEAGYPNGLEEEFGVIDFPCRNDYVKPAEVCQAIASMLGEVGIPVQVQVMDAGDYTQGSLDKTLPPLSYTGHGGSSAFIGVRHYQSVVSCEGGSPNWSGYYCNPEIDELIEEAQSIWADDQDRAVSLIEEAEQIFHEDAGYGFLFGVQNVYGYRSGLNWEPHPDGTMILDQASWD